jgi:probable rRNA maturation factor
MIMLEVRRGQAAEEWGAVGLSRSGLSRFLNESRRAVRLRGEVDVLLAGDKTLRRLNREFRGKDKATDVLSFPAAEEMRGEHAGDLAGGHAGDLAISVETAARQAREHGHSLRDEVRVLLLHGLLHLSGMDHETDRGEMAAREAELRRRLRLPSGLIARVEGAAAWQESRSFSGRTERNAGTKAKQILFEDDKKKGKGKVKSEGDVLPVSSDQFSVSSKSRTKTSTKRMKR